MGEEVEKEERKEKKKERWEYERESSLVSTPNTSRPTGLGVFDLKLVTQDR